MKKYNEQSILNFVSGKGSVLTKDDAIKAQKELSTAKMTIRKGLLVCLAFTVTNGIQWKDMGVRIIFIMQVAFITIWLLISMLYFRLRLNSEIPKNKLFQIFLGLLLLLDFDLMLIGGFRIIDNDINLIVPIGIFLLQAIFSFIYERIKVIKAITKNDGIIIKPFSHMKNPSDGIVYCFVTIMTGVALNGHMTILAIATAIVGTFITISFSRALTQQMYKWNLAKKYGLEDQLFKNVL